MIEEVKTNKFFIWGNFGLCTVLPLDGITCRWFEFRQNTHRLILFVLLCLQQVERVITVSPKTCYDKYSKCVCVYYQFSSHSIRAMLKRVYVCTTWRFPFVVVHCTQLLHHKLAEYTLNHGCAKVAHCVPARWRNFSHYCRRLRQYDVFWAQRSTDRRADSRRCTLTSD